MSVSVVTVCPTHQKRESTCESRHMVYSSHRTHPPKLCTLHACKIINCFVGVAAVDVLREGLEDLRDLYQYIHTTFEVHKMIIIICKA